MPRHIVCCDDDAFIRRAIQHKLTRAGYTVHLFTNGRAAFEALPEVRPECLITDLQMPRMTGLEVIEAMRKMEDFHDLPTILLTAKGFELDPQTLTKLRIAELMTKPFSPQRLLTNVESLFPVPAPS